MNFLINLPIKEIKNGSRFTNLVYFLISFVTIIYVSQIYRIILKSSDSLLLIRFTEDYVLIGLLFTIILFRGKLIVNNVAPFLIIFIYLSLNYLFAISDFDQYRRFIIMMLWYTIAINALRFLQPKTFFYIIASLGILAAGTMLINVEQTIADYVINSSRIHTEGEGMDININDISLILVAFLTILTVMSKNVAEIKYRNTLIFLLHICTILILLIGSSRSALLFYLLIVVYAFINMPIKYLIIPFLLFVTSIFAAIIFSEELIIISRFVEFDYQTSGRILAIQDSLSNFADNPMFGIGEYRQEAMQIQQIGDPDHNFYTRLLGSNGIIGFICVVTFLLGLIAPVIKDKKTKGIFLLQSFFLYSLVFSPGGPGIIIVASTIFYLSQKKNNNPNISMPTS